jgi:23S rRNA (cytosine1962-C5)-methyltransferase
LSGVHTGADALAAQVEVALAARTGLVAELAREGTDCWRVFHGAAEGRPGLTIDRYGELVLVQTFREPLEAREIDVLERVLGTHITWNHRGKTARESFADFAADDEQATREHVVSEHGVRFPIRARHRGLDPWLFLDLRAGRRELVRLCRDKTVVNFFAYTGSAAVAALAHGASAACNVDFARSSLAVAERSLELNGIDPARLETIAEDFFPVARQLAGLPVKGRASARPHVKLAPRTFDVAVLDPPAWSRGAFGAVDVVRDYPSLLKPVLATLADGGILLATNHKAEVELEVWRDVLERCAQKCGRPFTALDFVTPDADFPAFDGRPPLKIALARV